MSETNENKTFDFATAVKYLQEGKKVRPVAYENPSFFLFLQNNDFGSLELCTLGADDNVYLAVIKSYAFRYQWELYNG